MRRWLAVIALTTLATPVSADRVHLAGGSVIEGRARREPGKVVVELESGAIALASDSVIAIEPGESPVQRFEARRAQLERSDLEGRLALAGFCRDHGMREQERTLLLEIIDLSPDHAEARARLGYVRTDAGWITREEQLRAQGMVQHDGQWVSREHALELERLQAQVAIAEHRREQARVELARTQLALQEQREAGERERETGALADQVQERERVTPEAAAEPATSYAPAVVPAAYASAAVAAAYAPAVVVWKPARSVPPKRVCGIGLGAGYDLFGCSRTAHTRPRHARAPRPAAPTPGPGLEEPHPVHLR